MFLCHAEPVYIWQLDSKNQPQNDQYPIVSPTSGQYLRSKVAIVANLANIWEATAKLKPTVHGREISEDIEIISTRSIWSFRIDLVRPIFDWGLCSKLRTSRFQSFFEARRLYNAYCFRTRMWLVRSVTIHILSKSRQTSGPYFRTKGLIKNRLN